MKKEIKKIAVAMSGGLDSSMAAYFLKEKGHEVIGLFMDLGHEDIKSKQAAKSVCQFLNIEFHVLDFKDRFKKEIIEYFINAYEEGLTPNPCVKCNKVIKFGELFKEAKNLGCDYLATGHYLKIKRNFFNKKLEVYKAKDDSKDQSDFLYNLNQETLSHLIFPLFNKDKKRLRGQAEKINLPYIKKESQDICFLSGDHNIFLDEYIKPRPGEIRTFDGQVVGQHKGLHFYTIGQRRGIKIGGVGPFYVAQFDYKNNVLYVVKDFNDPILYKEKLICRQTNWISGQAPKTPLNCKAVIRYGHQAVKCRLEKTEKENEYAVYFNENQRAITPGQSVVFYQKSKVLGGGIIYIN